MNNMVGPFRMRQGDHETEIVAFDFDGTLTFRDSFMAFLRWRCSLPDYLRGLARLAPDTGAYLVHRDRGRIKAAAVRTFLKGVSRSDLEESCARFAQSELGRRLIRPDAEQCWRDWKARGALMTIVTASPDTVVAPFAARLGADVLIGTRLKFDADDRVVGAFETENCRGPEKVARLKARFGDDVRLAAAYGDTSGDREMLEIAEVRGFRVFSGRA